MLRPKFHEMLNNALQASNRWKSSCASSLCSTRLRHSSPASCQIAGSSSPQSSPNGQRYRAKVRRASAIKKEAEVTFIDYGNQDTASYPSIRPLDVHFRSLPGQAHDARLR